MNQLFSSALQQGRVALTVNESKQVLSDYGFAVNKSFMLSSEQDVQAVCDQLTFPVAMKIVSPQIIHKTDVGGVILNLSNVQEVTTNFNSLTRSIQAKFPEYTIEGVLLEEQIPQGIEFIAGVINDKVFGQCLMFGLGGIFVELVKDTSFRLIPASEQDIRGMIQEIKFAKILDGVRGTKVDKDQLVATLSKLSQFVSDHADVISEIDLNPIIATNDRVVIVDARIILKQ